MSTEQKLYDSLQFRVKRVDLGLIENEKITINGFTVFNKKETFMERNLRAFMSFVLIRPWITAK